MSYPWGSLPSVIVHTAAVYLFLVGGFLLTSRQLGQLNPVDIVVVLLLGSAVETAMVNGDTSLPAGLLSASTLLLLNWALSRGSFHSKRLRAVCGRPPVLLIHDGEFIEEHLVRTGFSEEDVLEAMRQHECEEVSEVRYCVLEGDGSLSFLTKRAHPQS